MSEVHDPPDRSARRTSESLFVVSLVVGVAVFAFGFTFLLLALTMDTTPPAPYLATTTDRLFLFVISGGALLVGTALVRWATRIAGW